jgi:hypothetical protein
MITLIRHKKTPLEKSLPRGIYYSLDPITAKKLIHVKNIQAKVLAIKRLLYFETKISKNPQTREMLRNRFMQELSSLEGSYTKIVLPSKEVLSWVPKKRRSISYENRQ